MSVWHTNKIFQENYMNIFIICLSFEPITVSVANWILLKPLFADVPGIALFILFKFLDSITFTLLYSRYITLEEFSFSWYLSDIICCVLLLKTQLIILLGRQLIKHHKLTKKFSQVGDIIFPFGKNKILRLDTVFSIL